MREWRPVLQKSYDLRTVDARAYIIRRSDRQPVSALAAVEAVLVGLMNGQRSESALKHLMCEITKSAPNWIDQSITRLRPLLADGMTRDISYDLKQLASVKDPDPGTGLRLLPGPRVLHWHVTGCCPRRCAYCYANPRQGDRALDATIDRQRLNVIFAEAAQLGATTLLVSGAEPLLRKDLPEILGDALVWDLCVLLTTKFPISRNIARRLANGGLEHISLSIDTLDSRQNKLLVGSSHYAEQVKRSVQSLKEHGLSFSVQTVVTRINTEAVLAVAEFAAQQGARVMQVVPFMPVAVPITKLSNQELLLGDESAVDRLVDKIRMSFPELEVERFREPGHDGGFHCDIGQTKLFFLPDGVVHRCYKLIHDDSLRGADLKSTSLARAWHDADYLPVLAPIRTQYEGVPCHGCRKFTSCHDSGRCIYESWLRSGRYAAIDRACGSW